MRTLLFVSLAMVGCSGQSAEPEQDKKPSDSGISGKEGSDWACFLGPLGTSVSTEKGIISPWPKAGLKLVWHMKTGTGYGAPSISKGKLFLFDRHGKKAR